MSQFLENNQKVQLVRQSIHYLVPLEVKKQTTEEERALSKSEEKEPSTTVSSNDRPRRNAAVVGELRRL